MVVPLTSLIDPPLTTQQQTVRGNRQASLPACRVGTGYPQNTSAVFGCATGAYDDSTYLLLSP